MRELVLLREYYAFCPDGMCDRTILTEAEREFIQNGGLILNGVIQRADAKNGNGRIYPRDTLDREMQKYQKLVEIDMAYGELDHADNEVVSIKESSHRLVEWWWKGNDLWGKLRIMPTPNGEIVKNVVRDGGRLGTSSRALGSLNETSQGALVGDDLMLICFDIVSNPSTVNAIANPMKLSESQILRIQKSLNPKSLRIQRAFERIIDGH